MTDADAQVEARESIRAARVGGTLVLTIDRQEVRNALTWDAISVIGDELRAAAGDDGVRAAVLTGAGAAFSAGGDLRDQERRSDWPIAAFVSGTGSVLEAIRTIREFPKPLIAAVNGVASGAGAGLALLADVRIAAHDARFGFSFPKVGLAPDFGISWTLPRAVGRGRAASLLYTAATVGAEDAHRLGLVEEVVEEGQAVAAAIELARRIGELAPLSIRLAKAGLRRADELSFAEAIDAEMLGQHIARSTEDHREGLAAFRERRVPRFDGDA